MTRPLTGVPSQVYRHNPSGGILSNQLSLAEQIQLIANGYEPIVIAGKAAVSLGWQRGEITPERITAMREAYPQARGTGLRTGRTVAIDIDIVDSEITKQIVTLATEILGDTPLHRFGSKGLLLIYKNDNPIRKCSILTDTDDKIEILGTGLQFAAFGIHPTTERPYEWLRKTDFDETANPLTVPLSVLPETPPALLLSFAERLSDFLRGSGYSSVDVRRAFDQEQAKREAGTEEDSPANIDRAREHLTNAVARREIAVLGQLGNDTIYEMACLLRDRFYLSHEKIEELMLTHWYPHCVPNTLEDECRTIISHAISYIQNEPGARALPPVADAFREALKDYRKDEQPGDNDLGPPQAIILQDADYDEEDSPIGAHEYINKEFPPLREIVPVWCERNTNTFLEGPAATQKSRAALQDAICISQGLSVLGSPTVERVEAIYLNYENSPEEMARRVHLICKALRISNQDAIVDPSGVQIWELRKHPRPILVCGRDGTLISRFGRRFLSTIATRRNQGKHTLVIFDGLMDALIFRDNTRNDDTMAMGIIRLLDSWCMEYDFTAYSIVHPSRSSERGNTIGSYATAWSTKPRAIQTFKRVLSPFAGGGSKAKITEDTPLEDIFYQRRVQKRSNGPEGDRMLLEYWRGGLRPHKIARKPNLSTPEPAPDMTDEVEF